MRFYNIIKILPILYLTLTTYIPVFGQNHHNDTIVTPFRKGKWLTGLSGTINSSTISIKGTEETTSTNEYGISLNTGRFIKDRFLIGGILTANRSNNSGTVERTTENIFIGPFASYYLSKIESGSLFFQIAPGYVRYRDDTRIQQEDGFIQQIGEGGGFGSLLGIGYSYAFFDRVTFDVGLRFNLLWITIDEQSLPDNTVSSQDIFVNNISFSFGFNILVDKF